MTNTVGVVSLNALTESARHTLPASGQTDVGTGGRNNRCPDIHTAVRLR